MDHKLMVARKAPSDHSDKKRTPKFIVEIQPMIDNDPASQAGQ